MYQDDIIYALMAILEEVEKAGAAPEGTGRTLSEILAEELKGIAEHLLIASVSGTAIVYPTAFPIYGTKERFFASFDLDSSGTKHDYTRRTNLGPNGYCEIRLGPAVNARWNDPDIEQRLAGISRFIEIILERKIMVENVSQMPFIDMSSGLFNTNGARHQGAILFAENQPSDYCGLFLNLRDTKLVSHKYGDRIIESYLTAVGHKLFSFVDTDRELCAHFGGDNYFLLIAKDRLSEFRSFLKNAIVELTVPGGESLQLPLETRAGIYEGRPADPIEAFMGNASLAYQATRHTGQDFSHFQPDMLEHLGPR